MIKPLYAALLTVALVGVGTYRSLMPVKLRTWPCIPWKWVEPRLAQTERTTEK
jgi:hypothetical protein